MILIRVFLNTLFLMMLFLLICYILFLGDYMRILIIEDEYMLADLIANRLRKDNFHVDIITDGLDGCYAALNGTYQLVLLDIMLPRKNGFDILKEIRDYDSDLRVILFTSKAELEDKLAGFSIGADDYITKPFHLEELVARVYTQLKRNYSNSSLDYLEVGNVRLNLKQSTISCLDTKEYVEIQKKEFELLEYFMQNPNQILSKSQLYTSIWGLDNKIESNNLEVYISFIRKKLSLIGANIVIRANRGLGYILEVRDEKTKI